MKKILLVIVVIVLILMNTTAYLILYKKYNDIVDYFNQDSQLTAERLESLDAKYTAIKAKVDEMAAQISGLPEDSQAALDDKIRSSQERIGTAMDEIRKSLSSKIETLNNDLVVIKEKIGIKQQSKKQ